MNPQMFGRFLLLDKVAAGGMAEVWRAKITGEGNFQKIIAIKKILPHVSEDEDFITMFTDEANITSTMNHANIGQVSEFSRVGDTYYIQMEYVSGRDLKSVWSWSKARSTVIPVELSAYIVSKMCDGLQYAHDRGVVHRDISPQNVLLSWEGDVKVIDFGIAKATEKSGKTRPGTLKGKFAYMAPEQIRGLPLDGRSDIFAIGVCLYEMVTGQRGFQAESEFSLLEMVRNVEIRPPSLLNQTLPAELERIIYKALAKDRDQRYLNAADMSVDLQQFMMSRGRPPQPRDLAGFLRENFTVDWDKERARLESYRDINPADYSAALRAATAHSAAPHSAATPSVSASSASSPSTTFDEDSAFSSSEPLPSSPRAAQPSLTSERVSSRIAPKEPTVSTVTTVSPAAPQPPASTQAPSSPRKRRLIAAGVAASLLVAGVAVGLWLTVLQPKTNVVVSVSGPKESTLRFDALPPVFTAGSHTFEKVEKGTHTLFVEAPGFVPVTLPVMTEGQPMLPIPVTLQRQPGKLVVTSEPTGAKVIVDNKPSELVTPATFDLDGDSVHEVKVEMEGYKPAVKADVRVPVNETTAVKLRLMPAMVKLRLVSVPEGASVKIGGVDFGVTPVVIERAPEDPYPQVTISATGCETMQTTVPFDREKAEDRYELALKCK
jgi:serine/threonine protein kinase